MSNEAYLDPTKRHDFVYIFDVIDGNPNGDPDAGNLPRVDPETMQGIVTDVCVKRKIRNYVDVARGTEERNKIYVENRGVLNEQHRRAYIALGIEPKGSKESADVIDKTRAWMCDNFYDIRAFGAVMTTGVNCGQVRGPMQLTFARSVDPIIPLDISITRVAITKAEDSVGAAKKEKKGTKSTAVTAAESAVAVGGDDEEVSGKQTEMGRKALVPYGLYVGHGFYNPLLAKATGFNDDDLALFWNAMQMAWDLDRSASRGMIALRGLYVFTHADEKGLGNAPAHRLFERITASAKNRDTPPRKFLDYDVVVNEEDMPDGITLSQLI